MTFGLSIEAFVALHVAISLIAILAGLVAMPALAAGRWLPRWQHLFLATTAATTLTGFLFPFGGITPAFATGLVSTVFIIAAYAALLGFGLRGRARTIYAVAATVALWLNLFVLVVQSFLKMPALHALAPLGTEPPFAATQGVVLIASALLGWRAVKGARVAVAAA